MTVKYCASLFEIFRLIFKRLVNMNNRERSEWKRAICLNHNIHSLFKRARCTLGVIFGEEWRKNNNETTKSISDLYSKEQQQQQRQHQHQKHKLHRSTETIDKNWIFSLSDLSARREKEDKLATLPQPFQPVETIQINLRSQSNYYLCRIPDEMSNPMVLGNVRLKIYEQNKKKKTLTLTHSHTHNTTNTTDSSEHSTFQSRPNFLSVVFADARAWFRRSLYHSCRLTHTYFCVIYTMPVKFWLSLIV